MFRPLQLTQGDSGCFATLSAKAAEPHLAWALTIVVRSASVVTSGDDAAV